MLSNYYFLFSLCFCRIESYSCKMAGNDKQFYKRFNSEQGVTPHDLQALSPPQTSLGTSPAQSYRCINFFKRMKKKNFSIKYRRSSVVKSRAWRSHCETRKFYYLYTHPVYTHHLLSFHRAQFHCSQFSLSRLLLLSRNNASSFRCIEYLFEIIIFRCFTFALAQGDDRERECNILNNYYWTKICTHLTCLNYQGYQHLPDKKKTSPPETLSVAHTLLPQIKCIHCMRNNNIAFDKK